MIILYITQRGRMGEIIERIHLLRFILRRNGQINGSDTICITNLYYDLNLRFILQEEWGGMDDRNEWIRMEEYIGFNQYRTYCICHHNNNNNNNNNKQHQQATSSVRTVYKHTRSYLLI
jgi:hypothetical protein